MEDAGAKMLTVHARTRSQGYHGSARWEWISKVKKVLSIPVIANGDIFSVESAASCLRETEADGVMCSRGTLGYPFLVGQIEYFLQTGEILPEPTIVEKLQCAKEHLQGLWVYKGERGIRQSRKHMAWYCKGFPSAGELRDKLSRITTVNEGCYLLDKAIASLQETQINIQ
jgi:nifR3 family TIM-barrel protein